MSKKNNLLCILVLWKLTEFIESDPDETSMIYKVSKSKILEKLCKSIISEQTKSKGIEELAKNVENPNEAAKLIKDMDKMIKIKKNNILMIGYQHGKIFRRFKSDNAEILHFSLLSKKQF